jgi:hypothetical protein
MADPGRLVIEVPEKVRAASRAFSIEVLDDASGKVKADDGSDLASFQIGDTQVGLVEGTEHLHEFNSTFQYQRADGQQLVAVYHAARNTNGDVVVDGTLDEAPFLVSASADGDLIEDTLPDTLSEEDKAVFAAMSAAFIERARFHTALGCGIAGLEVIVSAFTLEPLGVLFGFIGIVAECS